MLAHGWNREVRHRWRYDGLWYPCAGQRTGGVASRDWVAPAHLGAKGNPCIISWHLEICCRRRGNDVSIAHDLARGSVQLSPLDIDQTAVWPERKPAAFPLGLFRLSSLQLLDQTRDLLPSLGDA
jgi:hypothetical protein